MIRAALSPERSDSRSARRRKLGWCWRFRKATLQAVSRRVKAGARVRTGSGGRRLGQSAERASRWSETMTTVWVGVLLLAQANSPMLNMEQRSLIERLSGSSRSRDGSG